MIEPECVKGENKKKPEKNVYVKKCTKTNSGLVLIQLDNQRETDPFNIDDWMDG